MKYCSIVLFIGLFSCNSYKTYDIPYEKACEEKNVKDGYYVGKLLFYDKNKELLDSLDSYSEVRVLHEKGKTPTIEGETLYFPGTLHEEGRREVQRLKRVRYFQLVGCNEPMHRFRFDL